MREEKVQETNKQTETNTKFKHSAVEKGWASHLLVTVMVGQLEYSLIP